MSTKNNDMEIIDFPEIGFQKLKFFEGWCVAVLRYCEDLDVSAIKTMQRHDLTDEVFVLTSGECYLYLGGDGEKPAEITAYKMEKGKVYNIPKGVWHNHTMTTDGEVMIVENSNTSDDNSPILPLTEAQMQKIAELTHYE